MYRLSLWLSTATLLVVVVPVAAQSVTSAVATIRPQPGQMAVGSATLQDAGSGNTRVTVSMSGLVPNETHASHLHQGTCAQQGGIAHPLTNLAADARGRATATTVVAATVAELVNGPFSVNVHAINFPSPGIACGDIVAGAQQLPRSGAAVGLPPLVALSGLLFLLGGWLVRRGQRAPLG